MHALLENEKKAPPAIEPKKPVVSPNKKKEVDAHSFKLSKFKNVESKIKPLLVNRGNGGNVNEGTNVNLAKK